MISNAGGLWPKWRRDGRELFFVDVNQRRLIESPTYMGDRPSGPAWRDRYSLPRCCRRGVGCSMSPPMDSGSS